MCQETHIAGYPLIRFPICDDCVFDLARPEVEFDNDDLT